MLAKSSWLWRAMFRSTTKKKKNPDDFLLKLHQQLAHNKNITFVNKKYHLPWTLSGVTRPPTAWFVPNDTSGGFRVRIGWGTGLIESWLVPGNQRAACWGGCQASRDDEPWLLEDEACPSSAGVAGLVCTGRRSNNEI